VLRLQGEQVEVLWDEFLPASVRTLPDDLARLDVLLEDAALLEPIAALWRRAWPAAVGVGRPTLAMTTYVRLMVIKQRSGWGYETLLREVSDSLHLRRFCLIALDRAVPDESTVRKLTRRLGDATVNEITRALIAKAQRETRFRPRAVRIDSTVVEADVRYPTDAGLAAAGVRALARESRHTAALAGGDAPRVRDRSRSVGRRMRALGRSLRRRRGVAREEVLKLTQSVGRRLRRSLGEARRLAEHTRRRARGRGAAAKKRAAARLERLADRCERVCQQIEQRVRGERITERLVSLHDPDARPIRKGKLGSPNEFGYVAQIAEVTPNTRRGARGFVLPAPLKAGNPHEDTLLPDTVEELQRLALRPREVALDGGFTHANTDTTLAGMGGVEVFIAGRRSERSRRSQRRLARYRTGSEGRISHLKRGYFLRRSRLKGLTGARIHTGWAILTYDLDTYQTYA
jgi:IS5 family transposase